MTRYVSAGSIALASAGVGYYIEIRCYWVVGLLGAAILLSAIDYAKETREK